MQFCVYPHISFINAKKKIRMVAEAATGKSKHSQLQAQSKAAASRARKESGRSDKGTHTPKSRPTSEVRSIHSTK